MNKKWTENDINYVKKNINLKNDKEMAFDLSVLKNKFVSPAAVQKMRWRLGLKKSRGRGVKRQVNV